MSVIGMNELTLMPGGLRAGVERMKGEDFVHQSSLGQTLAKAIEHEAGAHHTSVDPKALMKIISAVRANKIQAWFVMVGMEIAGASIELPTVLTKWNKQDQKFDHYPAIYGEDTSVFSDASKTFRQRTKWGEYPEGMGLGTWFEHERIKAWTEEAKDKAPYGQTPAARIGEYSAHSQAMIHIFNRLNAKLGNESQPIMEVQTRDIVANWPVAVETKPLSLTPDGKPLPHVFVTEWKSTDGKQQVVASFTEAISTFTGDSIIRVQMTSNGQLPPPAILKDVTASLLAAGRDEAALREWGKIERLRPYSPIVRLHGTPSEMAASSFAVNAEHMVLPLHKPATPTLQLMRIHAFEPELLASMPYARIRHLGPHPMRPVVTEFAAIPAATLSLEAAPARPLAVVPEPTSTLILRLAA